MTNRRTLFAVACLGLLTFGIVLTTLGAVLPSGPRRRTIRVRHAARPAVVYDTHCGGRRAVHRAARGHGIAAIPDTETVAGTASRAGERTAARSDSADIRRHALSRERNGDHHWRMDGDVLQGGVADHRSTRVGVSLTLLARPDDGADGTRAASAPAIGTSPYARLHERGVCRGMAAHRRTRAFGRSPWGLSTWPRLLGDIP